MLRNGRRAAGKASAGGCAVGCSGRLGELAVTVGRTATVATQARSRLAGQMPDGATRLVSLHDTDARPIRKGRIDRPVEFGYKAQVLDNDDGIVVDYTAECGAVPDGPQLGSAIRRGSPAAPRWRPRGHCRPRLRPGRRRTGSARRGRCPR